MEDWRYILHVFLTSALDGDEWSASCPGCFTPGERASGIHWLRIWLGPGVGLVAVAQRTDSNPCGEYATVTI
jgi:hypothetical protein